jgi:integrase/recombinase XerD
MNPKHVRIVTRHRSDCAHKSEGASCKTCGCLRSLLIYHPEDRSQERQKTGAESWADAEAEREKYLKSHDPDYHELEVRRLADKENPNKRVLIETAIVSYINHLRSDKKKEGTIVNVQTLFGYADPASTKILRSGKYLKWLHGQVVQEKYLDEVTPEGIDAFVASWKLGDTTENAYRQRVRSFFKFCVEREWLERNPARSLRKIKIKLGNRTTAFTEEQFADILKAIDVYVPGGRHGIVEKDWKARLRAYVSLLWHSGADLVDATQFRQSNLKGNVFTYRRQKTGVQTWGILFPPDVSQMLRAVPDQYGQVGSDMPFRTSCVALHEDCRNWRRRLKNVFDRAGILSVETDVNEARDPHPKMMRDSFALNRLNSGVDILNVSKMLGHKSVKTSIDYYLPKMKSRDDAHLAMLRKAAGAQG